jgi:hypothetical protein
MGQCQHRTGMQIAHLRIRKMNPTRGCFSFATFAQVNLTSGITWGREMDKLSPAKRLVISLFDQDSSFLFEPSEKGT